MSTLVHRVDRRWFLKLAATGAASTCGLAAWGTGTGESRAHAAEMTVRQKTYTYKTVDGFEIQADVYRPDDKVTRPVAIWIHGGALIMGNRAGVMRRVNEVLLKAGYAVVSIDYRLAPETKIAGIIEDVVDACAWVRRRGPELFNVDTSKLAIFGGSAGGYLTLTAGFRVEPRPTVLFALWGYGDLTGDWYSQPSEFYRKQPLIKSEEALNGFGTTPVTDGSIEAAHRRSFYLYCRQNGVWPKLVTGFDPVAESAAYDPFSPVRNVTQDYPPTVLIHGTTDTDVPYEQSVLMAQQFEKHGVEHKFLTVPGAGHGLSDGDPQLINAAYEEGFAFALAKMK